MFLLCNQQQIVYYGKCSIIRCFDVALTRGLSSGLPSTLPHCVFDSISHYPYISLYPPRRSPSLPLTISPSLSLPLSVSLAQSGEIEGHTVPRQGLFICRYTTASAPYHPPTLMVASTSSLSSASLTTSPSSFLTFTCHISRLSSQTVRESRPSSRGASESS